MRRFKFEIGQIVEVIERCSHQGQTGRVVWRDQCDEVDVLCYDPDGPNVKHNIYAVKMFSDGSKECFAEMELRRHVG